ncbi:hypothetical protein L3Q82_003263 [Scortum barcoo]|uniref:Uncharacterized protein n=1 Tax=Scortum barcoo TaxID=214431 RepID=A0ACB8VRF5_9TELE|nr:hypothetical protein L3Q82_003263 [Scortum barcoo]
MIFSSCPHHSPHSPPVSSRSSTPHRDAAGEDALYRGRWALFIRLRKCRRCCALLTRDAEFTDQDYPQAAVPSSACRAAAESGGRLLDRRSVGMSDFWHKMGCCVVAKPPPKKRRKIDRSMIGEPTNFIHLTHIGSGEMAEGLQPEVQRNRSNFYFQLRSDDFLCSAFKH